MVDETIISGILRKVDSDGNTTLMHPETVSGVVFLNNINNSNIPSNIPTLSNLINILGKLALKSSIDMDDIDDILSSSKDDLPLIAGLKIPDASIIRDINDRLIAVESALENSTATPSSYRPVNVRKVQISSSTEIINNQAEDDSGGWGWLIN